MTSSRAIVVLLAALLLFALACQKKAERPARTSTESANNSELPTRPFAPNTPQEVRRLVQAAIEQTKITRSYDPSYVTIDYPGGDVPMETGVCSDVVVRAFRKVSIDLQKELHEDMQGSMSAYPNRWGLSKPDSNIDHRRVQNLMTWFSRKGKSLPISSNRDDYLPGDLVSWDLGGGVDHIGIVTNLGSEHYFIVHNIGASARIEDVLFRWKITGHYRYFQYGNEVSTVAR
jgi:uncharacterized protein